MLSHRSRSLMIAGWNKRQVHDQYGFTYKRLRSDFETYLDELPDSKISVDEILVYAPYDLQQISIYFWNSKVVFAVHCWSDW